MRTCPICRIAECMGPVNGYHNCPYPGCMVRTQNGREGLMDHLRVIHNTTLVPTKKVRG